MGIPNHTHTHIRILQTHTHILQLLTHYIYKTRSCFEYGTKQNLIVIYVAKA